jgi:DNA/RNA-binding domain of Phe-tRNA-synthetase-like protein
MIFQYQADILAHFPQLCGGVILARGMRNPPTSNDLRVIYGAEQQAVNSRLGQAPLSEIPSLAAWRSAFRAFNVDPTQYRSAAESLLRRLTKKGDIPSINTLVDIGNLVSIRYALPVAIFDVQALQMPVTVRFADGSERFTPLGENAVEQPEVGEVIFSDPTRLVIARRWCWRQSAESAAHDTTTDAIITVEAHHAGGQVDVEAAVRDLLKLLNLYARGEFRSSILNSDTHKV